VFFLDAVFFLCWRPRFRSHDRGVGGGGGGGCVAVL